MPNCPNCEGTAFINTYHCTDNTVSGEQFSIGQCTNCQMMLTLNPPTELSSSYYYKSEEYISHSNRKKGLFEQIYHQVRNYMLGKKFAIIKKHIQKSNFSALDIGAGTGHFLAYLRNQGIEVLKGFEPDEDARKVAKSLHGLHLAPTGDFYLQDEQVDVITLWHVLEHVHDLKALMAKIHYILDPNGILVIAVPNHHSIDASYYKENWAAWDVPRHLWHFNPNTMQHFLKKHGFTIKEEYPMYFDGYYVSMLSEKSRNRSFGYIKGAIIGMITHAIAIMSPRKASSMIYICTKQ